MSTQSIPDSPEHNNKRANQTFYLTRGFSTGSDFIYDQTYKNAKTKQKFQKDPKYSYFNAIMQMKKKLSSKEQLYNKVFTPKGQQQPNIQSKTLYSNINNSSYFQNQGNKLSLFYEPLDNEIVKIEQLKKNSFKIVKQQKMPIQALVSMKKQNSDIVNPKKRTPTSYITSSMRSGHKSNMSLYEKPSTQNMSFEINTKEKHNRTFLELEIKQQNMNSTHSNKLPLYQPSNPKPRLDQIMSQYRKINKHSHIFSNFKSKKSSIPKQFAQKLYQTNRLFYKQNLNKKRVSID